jgi:hypothetical protein
MKTNRESKEVGVDAAMVPDSLDIQAAQRITLRDISDHMTGPVVSAIAHVILLAFLATMMMGERPREAEDIVIHPVEYEIRPIDKIPDPPDLLPTDPPEEWVDDPVDVPFDQPEPTFDPPSEIPPDPSPLPPVPFTPLVNLNPSAKSIPIYPSRTPQGQIDAMQGVTPTGTGRRSQMKLLLGLRWLRDHQNPDGSWGDGTPQYSPALTGLALLTFLAHGETPASAEFGSCVMKGIRNLMDQLGRNGGEIKGTNSYPHGIATYALAEAYALTRSPVLADAITPAVRRIVQGQSPTGSYNYNFDNTPQENGKPRADLSISGWMFQALRASFAAGCTVPGIEEAMEKAAACMKNEWHDPKSGGFRYEAAQANSVRPTMTAVGTLCLQILGHGRSPEALAGVDNLERDHFTFDWRKPEPWLLYRTYYQTQVHFQMNRERKPAWDAWNRLFTTAVLREQHADGHWETPAAQYGKTSGGHGEQMFKGIDGPVYATTMSCLMLEVYYRHLASFEMVEAKPDKPAEDDGETRLIIE